jgi:hypothetical protein
MWIGLLVALAVGLGSAMLGSKREREWKQRGHDSKGRRADGSRSTFGERLTGTPRVWFGYALVLVVCGLFLVLTGNDRGAIAFPFALVGIALGLAKARMTRPSQPNGR